MKIKTEQEIDRTAIDHANKVSDPDFPEWHGRYSSFKTGARRMQSDLLESAGESFGDFYNQNLYVNELGELYTKVLINSKLRSSPITSNTFEKCWNESAIHHAKLIKEKDERIEKLKNELLNTTQKYHATLIDYQEAVKDIEWLIDMATDTLTCGVKYEDGQSFDRMDEIKAKYGLDKQERKS